MTKEKTKRLSASLLATAFGAMAMLMNSCSLLKKEDGIVLKNVDEAKNVILLIGDGMGPEQIRAGEIFKGEKLTMQKFPYSTFVETRSASSKVTDSAAAATALATGVRTNNGVVGRDVGGYDLTTIVDVANSLGKRTGIMTTEALTGATPMGFSAHSESRNNSEELISSAAASSNVNLFLSYTYGLQNLMVDGGYTKVENPMDISEQTSEKICGAYNIQAKAPSMSLDADNTAFDGLIVEALEYLSKDEDGFFLMAEGAHIDHGGHNNDFGYMLSELLAFDDTVKAVLEWAKDREDTVVIVTADHETGGLVLASDVTQGTMFDVGSYVWSTTGHTSTEVRCFINGADIDFTQ